jgi:hypothetical protein
LIIPGSAAAATDADAATLLFPVSKINADIHGLAWVMLPIV